MSSGLGITDKIQADLNTQLTNWADRFGPNFVLGLSGGGDSMALALGCARWMQSGHGTVHAVCVDHGLRDDSRAEAQQTVTWAKALGLTAQIISLNLERGQSRLQERAREGRHRALLAAAREQGARVILLAHNQDDQHETLALRLAKKTGLDGLAGMSALSTSPFYEDAWPSLIARPLLGMKRDSLRTSLREAGQSWHEDPSNTNLAFGRIRARARLKALEAAGCDITVLSNIASQAGHLRAACNAAAFDLLERADITMQNTQTTLVASEFFNVPAFIVQRALGWLVFATGQATRLPDGDKVERLYKAISGETFKGATLAGAKFQRRGHLLHISPAPPRSALSFELTHVPRDIALRLHAISGNLDQFVTHLG